ncbi:MAG TPA: hypothetical protein VL727_12470 [Puia sp.]|jgi:hypothetical protein|nr:hypothetical protein [Puia sp.]
MGKKADKERIETFKKDMELLKRRYDNAKIAELLGVDAGNLSSYYTGGKSPGKEFLDKFYAVLGEEIVQMKSEYVHDIELSKIEDAQVRYMQTAKEPDSNYGFQSNFDKIVDSNHLLAKSNLFMAESQKYLSETNQKMVEAHLSIFEELKRSSQNGSKEQ